MIREGRDLSTVSEQWSDSIEYNALHSLYSQLMVRRVKQETRNFDARRMVEILDRVKSGESLFNIAKALGFSSYKLAKLYGECAFDYSFQPARVIENPLMIKDPRIRADILRCLSDDPLSSNESENIKACVGREFEEILCVRLKERCICFETEAELRARGKPKTPDVLLLIPMAVEIGGTYHIVNWIDSKGMFADRETYAEHGEQLKGYVNRYGSGLVIYWYGYVDGMQAISGQNIKIVDEFPSKWVWPGMPGDGDDPSFDSIVIESGVTDI